MSMFRSESMGYFNIVMPRESAWEILNELGDVNNKFKLSIKHHPYF